MDDLATFRLGQWEIDPTTGILTGDGTTERLTPKVVDVLLVLKAHRGQVVGRDELLREVWGERAVTDEPLTRAIAELRRALGDDRMSPAYIETIPKRGYRLIAEVADRSAPAARAPAGRRPSGRNLWLAVSAAVVAAALVWLGLTRQPTASDAPRSIAVLPLADLNGRADMQYFADGVQDEIIARLAEITSLEVASRSAVMALSETLETDAIAARLGVDSVIQGTTLHADGRVRVNVQHVDADSGRVLWSRSFDRPLSVVSLFDIQSEIAAGVAAGFERTAGAEVRDLPTASWEAYEAFLLGKYHYRRRQPGDMRLAVDYLQSAVDADPGFAAAWDWLAYAWNHAGVVAGWTTPAQAFPRARAAASRAIELDPDNATALALLGYLRAVFDWDWESALIELQRAVAAAPAESGTVWSHAYVLSLLGRHEEAISLTRSLVDLYPGQGRYRLEWAWRLFDAGRYGQAAEHAAAALGEGAEAGIVHELIGGCAFALGEYDRSVAELELAVTLQRRAPAVLARLAAARAAAGQRAQARALVNEIEAVPEGWQPDPVVLAIAHTGLGNSDLALSLLERGVAERRRAVLEIRQNPFLVSLAGASLFDSLLERTGLRAGIRQ